MTVTPFERTVTPSDRAVLALANFIIRRRWIVILATLALVASAAAGGRFLEFSNNYRVFFSPDNPELVAFETFQDTYTKNDNILFVVQPADKSVFGPDTVDAVEKLTAAAWKIPYVIRVDSVTNFQHTWANGDELTVEDLVRNGANMSQAELDRRRAIALAEPLLHANLISPDAATTGIQVTLQYPEKSLLEVPEAAAHARRIADDIRAAHPDLKIALTGISMLNNAFAEAGQADVMTLVPAMYGMLILFMLLALRSVSGTAATLMVIAFSTAAAMGIAGYLGIKLTPISVTAPTIILTLAIADSIHILVSFRGALRDGFEKQAAVAEGLRVNFLPVTITSITTIVGFLSLNFSDAPPFWDLGNITAIGIALAWLLSTTFLPALMSLLPVKVPAADARQPALQRGLARLADFVIARPLPILFLMGGLAVGLTAFVPRIDLNDEFVKYFDHRVEFRNDADFATKNLTGIYVIEYSLEAKEPGGVSEPEYLANLERFTTWLRAQPIVTHVYSYADIIKRLNKNMHADDDAWHKLPEGRDLAAQYLLLYELSLPYGLDLNDRINIDKSATRVTATLREVSTGEIRRFLDRSRTWLNVNTPAYIKAEPTGAAVMFAYISQRNIESMLRGNAVAIVAIALIMMVALRSVGLGALSLVPNAVPILMTFGLWALLVGQVGMSSATVTATALGIVVDDTVHFLAKYLRARREKGFARPDAIRYAFRTVGTAIVTTTATLAVGFAVLAASTFKINAEMGLMTALAIVLALVVDFLLLPALLLIGHQPQETKELNYETTALSRTA